ncbi:hypothetical protein FA15DRAFT_656272 [Coprinopsis marcescibilis]|uniref:Uncharacterized protein n=1 Tax=Coprinopsis marcescibilis TaxID=230819 RepID=A0A5C3KUX7_COPMA|nr:hypothetical protein FA15DRAFT_656272 [Coprinopsis marcescibilis]
MSADATWSLEFPVDSKPILIDGKTPAEYLRQQLLQIAPPFFHRPSGSGSSRMTENRDTHTRVEVEREEEAEEELDEASITYGSPDKENVEGKVEVEADADAASETDIITRKAAEDTKTANLVATDAFFTTATVTHELSKQAGQSAEMKIVTRLETMSLDSAKEELITRTA